MNIFDSGILRLLGVVLIAIIPIILISLIIGRFSSKKFYMHLPSIIVFIIGVGTIIYSRTVTESMLDLAYFLMGIILVMSSTLSAILIAILNLINSRKAK